MRTAERAPRGIRALRNRIDYLYEEAEALEYEARKMREEAEKLERELEEAEEKRRNWPTQPREIRCFCGEPLVAFRPPPLGDESTVGQRPSPPVFELPRPPGRRVGACPACRADLEVVLAELATVPAAAEVGPGQLALPVEGRVEG